MIKKYLTVLALFSSGALAAQGTFAPLDNDYYDLIDRLDIKGYAGNIIFTSVKPYLRKDIAILADSAAKDSSKRFSNVDRRNLEYLRHDNWEWSNIADSGNSEKAILKYFYQKKNDFYQIHTKDFQFQLNPVTYFSYGKDDFSIGGASATNSTYINTRGIELRGDVDNKVGFYTFLTDNQAEFPQYVNNRIAATNTVPGEGFWKGYKGNGVDFFTAGGYIDFNITKHINMQFGQDKNIIGDGYRSLMLSDYSGDYLFAKVNLKVWKLEYTNIFAQMTSDVIGSPPSGDTPYPHKYMALHYLTLNLCKNFNIGLFECITFGNVDTSHNRGYDFTYLNPVIFYKAAENGLGAPDKDHIGACFKWNFLHHVSLYGTVLLDEFNIDEIKAHTGWWGNKQAFQAGLKYIDVLGIHNLDGQLEGNIVPPYTYATYSFSRVTDYSYFANYTNYMQPLADPNGANFYEGIATLKYQPCYRLTLTGKILYTVIGLDSAGLNYGSNLMLSNTTRVHDYGNFIGQGAKTNIAYLSFTFTYQIAHNMFIDLTAIVRNQKSDYAPYTYSDKTVNISFRWNIAKRLQEF